MTELLIKSYEELQFQTTQLFNTRELYCYRGQSNSSWKMFPTIFREVGKLTPAVDITDSAMISSFERDTYREFNKCQPSIVSNYKRDDKFENLAYAQHIGMPTRLLDWTRKFFIAAYFAVQGDQNADGCIFALNLSSYPFNDILGRQVPKGGYRIESLENLTKDIQLSFLQPISKPASTINLVKKFKNCLVFFEAPFSEPRITVQDGIFSVYLNEDDQDLEYDHLALINVAETIANKELVLKLIIPHALKKEIREKLRRINGIDHFHVFPDNFGLAKNLTEDMASSLSSLRQT